MINGKCNNHENPDLWFIEMPRGKVEGAKLQGVAQQVGEAISICSDCPAKQECYDEGMKPMNILYGIWGGTMAGDRLKHAGYTEEMFSAKTEGGIAMAFANRMNSMLGR